MDPECGVGGHVTRVPRISLFDLRQAVSERIEHQFPQQDTPRSRSLTPPDDLPAGEWLHLHVSDMRQNVLEPRNLRCHEARARRKLARVGAEGDAEVVV